ncbi:unnamed protein product [Linum tenue]|uniref:Cation/H+ exchanger domain-containing protein n=1 Tax=Linum tenue TaxID=586396 RepID=A0AAV0RDB7_9ROSI|nr:unnamed protein product [Linum tenue]
MSRQSSSKPTVEGWTSGVINVCVNESVPTTIDTSVFWKLTRPENENDPTFIHYAPYYCVQLAAILLGIHLVSVILRPLHLPRFSIELLAGILIGQGLQTWTRVYVVPTSSLKVLDTLGHLSLIYYVFLVGLEIDLSTVRHIGREAVYTGLTGTILPLFVGFVEFFALAADPRHTNFFTPEFWENLAPVKLTGPVFWGVALTVTSFPDLARILSDIKLLHTDMGKLALSSSIISELTTWILLVVALTLNNGTLNPLYLLPTFAFFAASWFLVRPAVTRILRHADETDNELLLNFTIFGGILTSSVVTEACGANSMIGAFVFGLVIPRDDVSVKIMENMEDIVKGVFIPVYFLDNGVRTSWRIVIHPDFKTPVHTVVLLVVVAWSAKLVCTFVFSKLAGMTTGEAFTLGVLMNAKGLLALMIINNGRNNQGFNQMMFMVLILSMFMMSVTVMPLAKAATRSNRRSNQFNRRTVESTKLESELRILTCIHSTRNLSGMISLLEHCNANKHYPISVFAVHLVQLTDRRATAMLIVHDSNESQQHVLEGGSGQNPSRREEESKHITASFESLESRGTSVSAQSLTVVSPYATMHEDIGCVGEDKRVVLILMPFHRQADVYGKLQDGNLNWRTVNGNLMAATACSVGILVDRGLGSKDRTVQPRSSFAVIFVGGPDDREALAFGWRMAKSPNVNLTVLRLLPTDDIDRDGDGNGKEEGSVEGGKEGVEIEIRSRRHEKKLDDEYVNEFRFRTMHDESINYIEKQAKTEVEVITTIARTIPSRDLYILGQNENATPSIMSGLSEWVEHDELGVLGDTLLTSEFAERSSLLIIKQHYVPRARMRISNDDDNKVINRPPGLWQQP